MSGELAIDLAGLTVPGDSSGLRAPQLSTAPAETEGSLQDEELDQRREARLPQTRPTQEDAVLHPLSDSVLRPCLRRWRTLGLFRPGDVVNAI